MGLGVSEVEELDAVSEVLEMINGVDSTEMWYVC